MTLDGFAGAERIAATLDVLADALVDGRATHYPLDALTAFRRDAHPAADALFGLRLGTGGGPGVLTVRGLGTVVAGSTARPAESAAGADQALVARYGAGTVRGVPVGPDAPSGDGASAAARFRLPVRPDAADAAPRPAFTAPLAAFASARPALDPEELSTGSGVEARLVVPSAFHPLTARGGGAAVAAHLAEVAEEVFAGGDAAARRDWSVLAASLADEATAAGVLYAGLSALRTDDRTSHASLVVSLGRASGPADELAHRLADSRPQAEVWTVMLPAGPAALLVEPRVATVPAALAADGLPRQVVGAAAVAVLPTPDGATALTLQLSTAQTEDWELYTGVFAEILQSVQLGWDGVSAAPAAGRAAEPVTAEPVAAEPVPAPPVAVGAPAPVAAPAPVPAPAPAAPE
ncbi:hypothetical protein, partial [Kitasatospora sp. NPDC059571]|uniref:hypothetical protein n=1 Tax=Kitasatospora sp. NPDC059571 TaxID=3346871 RepID=UPI00367FC118